MRTSIRLPWHSTPGGRVQQEIKGTDVLSFLQMSKCEAAFGWTQILDERALNSYSEIINQCKEDTVHSDGTSDNFLIVR